MNEGQSLNAITGPLEHPFILLEIATRSVPGSVHPYEDRILADEKLGLFAVADGVTVSSQGSGAVGAELALSLLHENFSGDLSAAITRVHQRVVARMRVDKTVGETTLTAVYVNEDHLQAGNVGDSPAYLVREGEMRHLSREDESPEGYITQMIGYPETVSVHSTHLQLEEGDVVIVASDGVEHILQAPFIRQIIGSSKVSEIADAIIDEAIAHVSGYDDDKSVIVLRVAKG